MPLALADVCAEADASVAVLNSCQGAARETQSTLQRARLIALLGKSRLSSPSDVPKLLQSLSKGKWSPRDNQQLVDAVSGMMSAPAADACEQNGSAQQDFTTFFKFLSASQWDRVQKASGEEVEVLRLILQSLGCRNPCEKTCRIATCILLLCTDAFDRIQTMTTALLQPMYENTKRYLKDNLKGVPPFRHLPATPEKLQESHPTLHSELYKSEGPTRCPFSLQQIEFIREKIHCRGGKRIAQTQMQQVQMRRMQSLEGSSGSFDAMAGILQQTVSQFMTGQSKLLDCLNQGRPSQPSFPLKVFSRRPPPSGMPSETPLAIKDQPSETPDEPETASAPEPEATEPAEEDNVKEPPSKKRKEPKPTGKQAMDAVLKAMEKRKDGAVAPDADPTKATGKSKTTPVVKRPAGASRVFWNLERSRSQVQARCVHSDGKSENAAFPFKAWGGMGGAVEQAEKWTAAKKEKLGLA